MNKFNKKANVSKRIGVVVLRSIGSLESEGDRMKNLGQARRIRNCWARSLQSRILNGMQRRAQKTES